MLLATVAAYLNSLSGPLIFDDSSSVTDNPSIRRLWPLGPVLAPPADCTVAGRPFANLSFALNYAVGGLSVRGYHVVNVLLHASGALLVLGIVRRSLSRLPTTPAVAGRGASRGVHSHALAIATCAAAVWGVHPLLTSTVSYISQRTELLMSFCYLATLYTFIRGAEGGRSRWQWLSVAACWLGMGSKEGMVTAPVVVLLYDATFVAGTIREALRRRAGYYAGLAGSWVLLGVLMKGLQHRAVGFELGVTWWRYAFTECQAVLHYLRLIVWPQPLIFDYGAIFLENPAMIAAFAVGLAALLAAVFYALRRWPTVAFPALAFFLILAPTSSVVPISAQPIAENRVYLAAAPVIVLFIVGLFRFGVRSMIVTTTILCLLLGGLTIRRNRDYQDPLRLWADTAAKRPLNPRALENLGELLFQGGALAEARRQFEQALRLKPDYPEALNNLGATLHAMGESQQAIRRFEEAIRVKPDFASAHNNLGNALLQAGRIEEARAHLEEALRLFGEESRLKPDLPDLYNNLGNVALYQGRNADALKSYDEALRQRPAFPQAEMNAGVALRQLNRVDESIPHFNAALALRPDFPEAHFNLALSLLQAGDMAAAQQHLEAAVQLRPAFVEAHQWLGDLLLGNGRVAEARRHYELALQSRPDDSGLQERLRRAGGLAAPNF